MSVTNQGVKKSIHKLIRLYATPSTTPIESVLRETGIGKIKENTSTSVMNVKTNTKVDRIQKRLVKINGYWYKNSENDHRAYDIAKRKNT
ncbi:MAG: hypothetical protein KGL95_13395 [Patescibacteria group bacterium]|nr:hypothetical protein [Patescibacteria group bacterium]